MTRILRFGAFSLLLLAPGSALAWGNPLAIPVKVDAGINVRFNVYFDDQTPPLAPWYLYWPAEAQYQAYAPTGMNFPNWPAQWPPAGTNADAKAAPSAMPPPGPGMVSAPQLPQYAIQPTGYSAAPSYWYGK